MDVDTNTSSAGEASAAAAPRKRVSTACEACRVTKIKCEPSEQPGVCRNVVDGPHRQNEPAPPPAPGPSKTFTIDFDVPSLHDADESFDSLRDSHAQLIEAIFPPEPDSDAATFASSPANPGFGGGGFPTPPSSHSHSIQSLHAKPQFNVDSAASLLASFRGMLVHFPCVALRPDETVASLAASRPFVLLAILAAASGSRTLQGHTLYDEEFRKVLGLKFVAGGERSLELLQGMLIYCAWYPFHLRPKNKQAFQYIRMARDLVHDLELDQEMAGFDSGSNSELEPDQLEKVRTYLSWYYGVSQYVQTTNPPPLGPSLLTNSPSFMSAWKRMDDLPAPFTSWTATCCDTLQRCAECDGDFALVYLVRLASHTSAAHMAIHENKGTSQQQSQLVLLGLELQDRELRQAMLPHIARSAPVKIAAIFFSIYLDGGCLLRIGRSKTTPPPGFVAPTAAKLRLCVGHLGTLFTYLSGIDQSTFISFTTIDWSKVILSVILGVRLSFPLAEVAGWDDAWARGELGFVEFLAHMCEGGVVDLTPANTRVDVLSASRVVLRVVKDKYDRRMALHAGAADRSTHGCPMFDSGMAPFISSWDANFDVSAAAPSPARGPDGQQPVFHDLWATMTMGWAEGET
ncbi:hypothetical protein AK830_g1500 [Neonectria ditissima]|uniref:Transcription factor domain-containing protein n=1 Tax=Neonectria ditissima TaxID=78410 RepID=A0A0P7B624_9HYPO|nr:hypothetical protein AK830_g1500 [Neonectria ditissima]